jgi:hypothetical protein
VEKYGEFLIMPADGRWDFNSAFEGLIPICHLLTLLGAHHIFHVSRIRVNSMFKGTKQ